MSSLGHSYLLSQNTRWIFLALVVLAIISASPKSRCQAAQKSPVRLCGDKLIKMVMGLCGGCIQGTRMDSVAKRGYWSASLYGDEPGGRGTRAALEEVDEGFGNNAQYYHPRETRRSGIATECCERTCTYTYLKSFCCDSTNAPASQGENAE